MGASASATHIDGAISQAYMFEALEMSEYG